jgi:ABC-type polysaccharide/polyol phosphate transport system ATPase subunit
MNSLTGPDLLVGFAAPVTSPPVVTLENVSVRYRAPEERAATFKEYAIRRLQRPVRYTDFYALQQVSAQICQGEVFGIIGRNGAGKSTLLKVISRVVSPTAGRLRIRGRVSPLLELGAGFHPELTGRENIFLNGTLLGHSHREIESHMQAILDFAELGRFIDGPLRTYSSGMVARLGFAVATAWQPEILLLDEILAVGDESFRSKCLARMEAFRIGGTTTLLVTHDTSAILSMCSRAVWLEAGCVASIGPAAQVVEEYHRFTL